MKDDDDHLVLIHDVETFVRGLDDPNVIRSWIHFYQARLLPSEPGPAYYAGTVAMKTANQSYLQALEKRLAQLEAEYSRDQVAMGTVSDQMDDESLQDNLLPGNPKTANTKKRTNDGQGLTDSATDERCFFDMEDL